MEGRGRLAVGALTSTTLIAAVATAVLTNSAALADVPGAPVEAAKVVLPSAMASSATSPTVGESPVAVEAPQEASASPAPVVTTVATMPSADTEDLVVLDADVSDSWDSAYAWCKDHGWTQAQTEAWITRLESKLERLRDDRRSHGDDVDSTRTSGRGDDRRWSGSKEDRSHDSPDHRD